MASKGDVALFLLILLGISLAGSYVVVYGTVLLDGLSSTDAPVETPAVASSPVWHETSHTQNFVLFSAGYLDACGTVQQEQVAAERPTDVRGAVIEVVLDSPIALDWFQRLRVLAIVDDAIVAETSEPDERGVLRMEVTDEAWPKGRLFAMFCPDPEVRYPSALVAARVDLYATLFHGAAPPHGFSAVASS